MSGTHWRKAFKSDFLASADIDLESELALTISHVEQKQVTLAGGRKEAKNVAYFTDKQYKPMILNATNCKILKKFTGKGEIEYWRNVTVIVYVDPKVSLKGEEVEGLRFRPYQPVPAKMYECTDCGCEVNENMKVRTVKAFGVCLCVDCGKKRSEPQPVVEEAEEDISSDDVPC